MVATSSNSHSPSFARLAVITSLICLGLIISVENWLNEPMSIARWFVQVIPLLAFLPGLINNKLRTYQWLCFVILLYFIIGILSIFTADKLISGIMLTFFSVLLFCSAIFYIHFQQKALHSNS